MLSEWGETTLEEVAEIIDSRHKTPVYSETGIPMVRVVDVNEGVLCLKDTKRVSDEVYSDFSRGRHTQIGDLIISRVGSYGNISYVNFSEKFCLGQNTAFIIPKINWRFLYYQMISTLVQNQIEQFVVGAVQKTISLKNIRQIAITLPPLPEQKAIAHILGSLDDKIELNRKMNETLEAMAQAMFKSWFVDFDPVIDNALAAGNTIPEELTERAEQRKALGNKRKKLAPEIKKLFPSEFIFTDELGWIPKGWEAKTVGDLVDTVSKTYPLKSVSKVIFLNTGDIKEGKFLHNSKSDASSLPGQAKKSIQKGDILYSEIRPQNKRFAFVHFDSSEYVVSTKLMVLRSKGEVDSLFTYFILKQQDKIDYLQMMAESRSGTFPQITFDVLSKIQIVIPEASILNDFIELLLRPIFEKSLSKDKENENLSKLRDTLLPKLLSGELKIENAEKLVDNIKLRSNTHE